MSPTHENPERNVRIGDLPARAASTQMTSASLSFRQEPNSCRMECGHEQELRDSDGLPVSESSSPFSTFSRLLMQDY